MIKYNVSSSGFSKQSGEKLYREQLVIDGSRYIRLSLILPLTSLRTKCNAVARESNLMKPQQIAFPNY